MTKFYDNANAEFACAFNPAVALKLLQELRSHREREANQREYAAKLCPHGFLYHAECPECAP